MTIKELRNRKASFLRSNDSSRREYGRAYTEIEDLWKKSSVAWMSEEIDLSDIAKKYFDIQKIEYDKDGAKFHQDRMAAASDFFVRELDRTDVEQILTIKGIKTFNEAQIQLRNHPDYNKIHPKTVKEIFGDFSNS